MVRKAAACLALGATSILGLLGAQALGETAAAETGLATTVVATTADLVTSEPDEEPEPDPDPEPEPEPPEEETEQPGAFPATSTQEPLSPAPSAVPAAQPGAGQRVPASGTHSVRRSTPGTVPDRTPLARAAPERERERKGPARTRRTLDLPSRTQRSTASPVANVAAPSRARKEQLFNLPLVSSLIPDDPPLPSRGLAAVALAATGAGMFGILALVLRFFRRTWNP